MCWESLQDIPDPFTAQQFHSSGEVWQIAVMLTNHWAQEHFHLGHNSPHTALSVHPGSSEADQCCCDTTYFKLLTEFKTLMGKDQSVHRFCTVWAQHCKYQHPHPSWVNVSLRPAVSPAPFRSSQEGTWFHPVSETSAIVANGELSDLRDVTDSTMISIKIKLYSGQIN